MAGKQIIDEVYFSVNYHMWTYIMMVLIAFEANLKVVFTISFTASVKTKQTNKQKNNKLWEKIKEEDDA